ncbi:MAG TPA: PAS domain S-box protein [Bacteroidota bacterium]|nr:PAS domain S-box protein [Bacteroidota bacterium]
MKSNPKSGLRTSESRRERDDYREIFRQHPVPLMICAPATHDILDVNDATVRAYGYTRKQILALRLDDLIAPATGVPPPPGRTVRRRTSMFSGEQTHARRDGRVMHVSLTSREIRFRGRGARLVHAQDVTERTQIEHQLALMSRLYATLSQVNQTIVRVREREELFQSICGVAGRFGEFPLVWIALFDESTGDLRPAAAYGMDVTHWPYPVANVRTGALRESLSAEAFRSSKVVTSEDISADSRLTTVLDHIKGRPYRSSASVPFQLGGKTIGVLNLLSATPGIFRSSNELKLLREMGTDISYALDRISAEQKEREEEERLRSRDRTIRTFVEQAPAAIAVFDREMRYIATSRRYLSDYHLADQPVIGRSHYELFPEIPERWKEIHRRCLAGAVESAEDDAFPRADGSVDWVQWEVHPWYETAGSIGGIILFSQVVTRQKKAEEQLRESERRFRQLFDNAPVGYHEIDEDGRIVHVNRTELDMLGYSLDDMRHHYVWEFVEDGASSRAAFAAKLAGAATTDNGYERVFRRRNGGTLSVLLKDRVLRDQSGRITGVRSALQDISDRKAAERELRLMGHSVASAQDCIAITDLEHRILYVNRAVTSVYGHRADELYGREIFTLSSVHTPPASTAERLDETLKGGWHGEVVNRRKDGSEFPVEVWTSIVRDEFDIPVAVLYVARDITERKEAEERIRQTESQFRLIAENVTDLIAVLDPRGTRVYLSPSYRSVLTDPDAMIGTDGFSDVHPGDRDRVLGLFRTISTTGAPVRGEYRTIRADGIERMIEARASAVRGPDGSVVQVVIVSRDVTEEKRIAAQFLRAQRMESVGTLASGIAHDLNNVLAPIMMSIEVLKARIPGPAAHRVLNTIEAAAKRGSDIVRQVLAFGRGVAGDHIPVQPRHVIGEVVKIARETFPRSIDLAWVLPRDIWTIMADPTQLHQVLLNIFVNARDAMPHGGTLAISAENVTVDDTFVRMHPEAKLGTYIAISISDSGEGIPAEIREKIFEPFFTTKEVGKGTGLGLSTTLAIVKSHGGFINLYSEVSKGTTFKIYFPATPAAPDAIDDDATSDLPMGHGELVLVIDDEAAIREITKETLEAYGYSVLTARDGQEGVAVFADHMDDVRVVVTDVMMPVMDGSAAILALRRLRGDVRIIATSGLTTKERVDGTSDPAVKAFIAKPYTAAQLLRALSQTIQ